MKVKVVISFHDAANFSLVHKVGDVIDVPEERAQKLIELKLVTKVAIRKVEPKEEPKVEEPVAEAPVEETKEAPVETAPEVPEEAEKPKRRRSRR